MASPKLAEPSVEAVGATSRHYQLGDGNCDDETHLNRGSGYDTTPDTTRGGRWGCDRGTDEPGDG